MAVNPNDIAIETLQNQSSQGLGIDKKIAFVPINLVGVATHRDEDSASSSPVEINITAGHRTLEIQNADTDGKILYYGGTGVSSSNGIKLFPNQTKVFANVQDTFSIFVVADGSDTPEYRIVEYT